MQKQMKVDSMFGFFDKGNKMYLSKTELRSCLIYKFGFKFPKTQISEIWSKRRMTEEESRILKPQQNSLVGVTFSYFLTILQKLESEITTEKQSRVEFSIIDKSDAGFITFNQFLDLLNEEEMRFLEHYQIKEIFNQIDSNSDGVISLSDYQLFVNKYKQTLN